jgi:hypothetical protein
MKSLFTVLLLVYCISNSFAQGADKKELEQRVRTLEERIAVLEERIARVEGASTIRQETPEAIKMEKVAKEHIAKERDNFKAEDIQSAEEIYKRASKLMRKSEDSKSVLDSVVTIYPQLNRAGCAQLYRAQQETGAEMERLLKDCIARFFNCYYGDGVQVGPLAMFRLAEYYRVNGNVQEAHKLYVEIRKEYPDAVNHSGALLVDRM